MNKITFCTIIIMTSIISLHAQIYTPDGTIQGASNNSNVGIGTANPTQKLEINGNGQFNGAIISSIYDVIGGQINLENTSKISNGVAKNWRIYNMTGGYGNSLQFWAYDNLGCVDGGMCSNRFTIMDNGNVGIGTLSPTSKLDVNGDINMAGIAGRRLFMGGAGGSTFGIAYDSTYPNYGIFYTEGEPDYVSISPNGNATAGVMNIFGNGNVGIGTTNPTSKLTVAGNINAREVKVTVDAGADFVFDKDYDLPSLTSVNNYIKQNKHLPKIASAKEMQANGINLSEMNIKLLQKVEEMTLYMIDFKKQIDSLKNENRVQQEEIETLKETKK